MNGEEETSGGEGRGEVVLLVAGGGIWVMAV